MYNNTCSNKKINPPTLQILSIAYSQSFLVNYNLLVAENWLIVIDKTNLNKILPAFFIFYFYFQFLII